MDLKDDIFGGDSDSDLADITSPPPRQHYPDSDSESPPARSPSPLPAPAPATAARPYRPWSAEELEYLDQIVAAGRGSASRVRWQPILDQMARRYPPSEGWPARTKNQTCAQWNHQQTKRRASSPLPDPPAATKAKAAASTPVQKVSPEDEPFTAIHDRDLLALHRLWPSQPIRIGLALKPPRRRRHVKEQLEHLLSAPEARKQEAIREAHNHQVLLRFRAERDSDRVRQARASAPSSSRPSTAAGSSNAQLSLPSPQSTPASRPNPSRPPPEAGPARAAPKSKPLRAEEKRAPPVTASEEGEGSFGAAWKALEELSKPW